LLESSASYLIAEAEHLRKRVTSKQLTLEHLELDPAVLSDHAAPWPFVSVIVPCRNEERHIARSLESILANDYPPERREILVVDGMSEDRTREIVQGYAARYEQVRVVNNPQGDIPAAMNTGICNARGETILKMDAHSTYQSSHIRRCVEYQEKYGAENVGGVWKMVPGSDTAMARAIVLGMAHRFGSGNAKIKVGASQPTWSDSAAFGCFKKELFSRIGLFDERLKGGSDMDMNIRIRAAGGRVLLVPEIVVNYGADANLKKFWKHNFADGVWTSYVIKFGRKASSWRHWVPAAFVLSLLVSFSLSAVWPFFLWVGLVIAGIYVATTLGVSAQIAIRERDLKQLLPLPAVFATRHIAHGLGALFGLMLVALPWEYWKGRRGLRT
jgi:glycosyltransferase involved in cell wall biosynthesis